MRIAVRRLPLHNDFRGNLIQRRIDSLVLRTRIYGNGDTRIKVQFTNPKQLIELLVTFPFLPSYLELLSIKYCLTEKGEFNE